jgi:hexosaminidase
MHLDVGRHFFPAAFVKKYIDLLAAYKMNVFHWHLTEDQGWRIEIKKYPRLTAVGSQRRESMGDCTPHGGFYTQEEIRDIVAYARDRFVTIVPEIEMPGHALAALASYPELSCSGGPFQVGTAWGVMNDVYCAGNEKTFAFLEDVIGEVTELFPGPFFHAGGDECPKIRWQNCAKCQARIKAEGLKDEHELQSYFLKRIGKILNAKGKRMVGWDEILEGGLAPNATVMSWRGTEGGIAAAKSGHDVVMTPTSHCYFDYYQGTAGEPAANGGFLPLEQVYGFEPVPDALDGTEASHVLGAQGNVWTEWMPTTSQVEYMVLPRMLAMSEVLWSSRRIREYAGFLRRLGAHYDRFAFQHLNFRVPTPLGIGGKKIIFHPAMIEIRSPVDGGTIHYTIGGADPTVLSPEYQSPVPVRDGTVLKAMAVLPNGMASNPVTTTYTLVDEKLNGLRFRYYEGAWDALPDFSVLKPRTSGRVYDIDLDLLPRREDEFAVELEGVLNIPRDGGWTFFLSSDDGSRLFLDGVLLIDHDGLHGATEKSAAAALTAGKHAIRLEQFERGGGQSLALSLEGPGLPKQPVPPTMLTVR